MQIDTQIDIYKCADVLNQISKPRDGYTVAEEACEITWITSVKIVRFFFSAEMHKLDVSPSPRIFLSRGDEVVGRRSWGYAASHRDFHPAIEISRLHRFREDAFEVRRLSRALSRDRPRSVSPADRQLSLARQRERPGILLIRYHRGRTTTLNHNRASLSSFGSRLPPPPPPPPTRGLIARSRAWLARERSLHHRSPLILLSTPIKPNDVPEVSDSKTKEMYKLNYLWHRNK